MYLNVKMHTINTEFNSQNYTRAHIQTQNFMKFKIFSLCMVLFYITIFSYNYVLHVVQIPSPQHSISHF